MIYRVLIALAATVVGALAVKPVNVVMIMADDVGYECFSTYGSKEYHTPRLDALAAKGIRFDNCHSTPLCTPSRVNLMSGKSNVFNYVDFGVYPKGEATFANYFKQHGYATAVAGKWQLKYTDNGITPEEAGFDTHMLWNYSGTGKERYWKPSLISDGKITNHPQTAYGPTIVTDFLVDFITTNKDKPFLAYYPMILPHSPFPPTPDSADKKEKDTKKNFVDMVQYMDKCVGRIEDALIKAGIRDNTLIIFTGDNGTHANIVSELENTSVRGAKGYTRDHGTHVPLIINLPGTIPAGQVNDDLICFSDFFATMTDAAGLPARTISDGDGWSFWPQCLGKLGKKRDWIYCYYFPRPYNKRFDTKYSHYEVRFTRNKQYKLYDNGKLFDVVNDVLETKPLEVTEKLMPVQKQLQAVLDQYPKMGKNVDRDRVTGTYQPKKNKK